ncbi:replication protein A 70 kDa DNA-binding subunit-like isoform X1 [Haliotis rufescens]|uniref:replication protein A 70 kDa DNA-binding subunit-like isoform X1 n=1 Tax=Haliotis rufescens TaxID=6454 RepID=UPI001EAFAF4D|nr:replication protein A 70 kDa DNA-binding subunit-like isoform X1 [Haliotis rufescens]
MPPQLSSGSIEEIIGGNTPDSPILQIMSSKKISAGGGADRYRLLLSDGKHSYSHAMLATQLNELMEQNEIDNLSVVQVNKYLCNTLQGDRRVMILLDVKVVKKGSEVGERIGNPVPFKPGQENTAPVQPNGQSAVSNGPAQVNGVSNSSSAKSPYNRAQTTNRSPQKPSGGAGNYSIRGGAGPSTPGSSRVHTIASLTPYQNRWRIRARVTQKSGIRTWSNSRGEGKLFSVNFLDESGEIRATGFNEAVDRFYELLEVNKVFFVSRATLKTANKQYSNVQNDYEMTFNPDSQIEICNEECDLPTMTFEFVKINELDKHQSNALIDIVGVVKVCQDLSTVVGRQSQKEITKRDLQIVDQSGMGVNLTLWGNDAQAFDGSASPVIAVKGARLSDYGGRSLSVLASSQLIVNPDIREAHMLRGWFDRDGQSMDFDSYRNEGGGGGAGMATNWKTFQQVKSDNIASMDKADYFTSKGTVVFLKKDNCMYKACPTEQCNKKLVDQGNGLYRCEKCAREFPNYKWRMILNANLADYSDNQWATCFQDSAEVLLSVKADELGSLRDSNEASFDQVFQDALFKSYIFKFRAKMEMYNDEQRLKTVCMSATPIDWTEYGKRLVDEINKLTG